MRRFKQQLADSESKEILKNSTNGVLSLIDSGGYPYGVPMSFVFDGDRSIFFHCAKEGKKLDCISQNPNGCFTVVAMDAIHPEEFTTYFRSVVAMGKVEVITDRESMHYALRLLAEKYSPGFDCMNEVDNGIDRVTVLCLRVDKLTGKEAIELVRQRMPGMA